MPVRFEQPGPVPPWLLAATGRGQQLGRDLSAALGVAENIQQSRQEQARRAQEWAQAQLRAQLELAEMQQRATLAQAAQQQETAQTVYRTQAGLVGNIYEQANRERLLGLEQQGRQDLMGLDWLRDLDIQQRQQQGRLELQKQEDELKKQSQLFEYKFSPAQLQQYGRFNDEIAILQQDPNISPQTRAQEIAKRIQQRDAIRAMPFPKPPAPQYPTGQGIGDVWIADESPSVLRTRDKDGQVKFHDIKEESKAATTKEQAAKIEKERAAADKWMTDWKEKNSKTTRDADGIKTIIRPSDDQAVEAYRERQQALGRLFPQRLEEPAPTQAATGTAPMPQQWHSQTEEPPLAPTIQAGMPTPSAPTQAAAGTAPLPPSLSGPEAYQLPPFMSYPAQPVPIPAGQHLKQLEAKYRKSYPLSNELARRMQAIDTLETILPRYQTFEQLPQTDKVALLLALENLGDDVPADLRPLIKRLRNANTR